MQSSCRQAPIIIESVSDAAMALRKKKERSRKNGSDEIQPSQELLERIKDKQTKRKTEEETPTHRPNKVACEREERMATVQLKAYWATFPLTTSLADLEGREASESSTGQSHSHDPRKRGRNERKQLLETLRSTIEDKGQAQAKKRKTHEPAELSENSETGKDQKDFSRGTKVEAGKTICGNANSIKGECNRAPTRGKTLLPRFNLHVAPPPTNGKLSPSLTSSRQGKLR